MANMTPEEAYKICYKKNKRITKLENIIASSSYYSYMYARDVVKNRFEEGEKEISTASNWSFGYAKNIIKAPFPLGHPAIFNSESSRSNYSDFLENLEFSNYKRDYNDRINLFYEFSKNNVII
jgi:hypothetical protein